MNKEDHPRGLSPEQRIQWHRHCNILLDLYRQMPQGTTRRKVVAGGDEWGGENCIIFFKGTEDDVLEVHEFISRLGTYEE